MIAQHFTELIVWQLSNELRELVGPDEFAALWRLTIRASTANASLQQYLRTKGRNGPLGWDEPEEPQEPQEGGLPVIREIRGL
jgi:hypothetical protein